MPKVSDEHRESMRERIRQAGVACAARKGLQATTMNDVIAESGLSAGAIYSYYASKEELLYDVAQTTVNARIESIPGLAGASRGLLGQVIIDMLSGLPAVLAGGLLLQVWAAAVTDPAYQRLTEQIYDRLTEAVGEFIERSATAADAHRLREELVPAILGLAQGYIVTRSLRGVAAGQAYLDSMAPMVAARYRELT